MTPEEAIRILNDTPVEISSGSKTTTREYSQMLHLAENALEKQIPKKPHKNYEKLNVKWCECGSYLGELKNEQNYCKNCGQALDWRET